MNPQIGLRRKITAFFIVVSLGFVLFDLSSMIATAQGQVQVTAADPPSAAQGTINLNVKVTGKGFKNGAKAKWLITGTTDPGGVQVNSTTFVNAGELTANITVADTAVIANFDIAVTNPDGRGGKGTELFAVTSKGSPTSCGADVTNLSVSIYKYTDATNTTTYNLQPDLTNADGSPVPYVTGKVRNSNILAQFQISNCTYDFTLNLNSSNRFMTYKFSNGSPLGTSVNFGFFNIDRVADVPITDGGPAFQNWCSTATDNYGGCGVDADGYFVRRAYGSTIDSQNRYHLRFNYSPLDNNTGISLAVGTAYVKVYHTDATTWTLMPEVTPPPPGVIGTDGEWSVLLDISIPAVLSYQKTPFKILVKKV